MKLRTSFFNPAVLKKDITRFMPVWALYTIALVIFQTLLLSPRSKSAYNAMELVRTMQIMSIWSLIYGGICAMTLFSDLYVPKMCNAIHAMPMRREGWFLTHAAAGLLFGLVPNALGALIAMPALKEYAWLAWIWLAAVLLQFVFFYGLALLCAMCAGSRLGMLAMYATANCLAGLAYTMILTVYGPILYGVVPELEPLRFLIPIYPFLNQELVRYHTDYDVVMKFFLDGPIWEGWAYEIFAGLLGVAFAAAAMVLYRRRHLERAGDFLAVRALSPLFLVMASLGAGMVFYLLSELAGREGSYLLLFVGMAVGWFVGKMLLERNVRVFRLRNTVQLAVLCVVIGASLIVTRLDPLQLISRVPAEDEIRSVSMGVIYNPLYEFTTPEEIHQVTELHEKLWQQVYNEDRDNPMGPEDGRQVRIRLRYQLTDGSELEREYWIHTGTEIGQAVQDYLCRWQVLLQTDDAEELIRRMQYADYILWVLPQPVQDASGAADTDVAQTVESFSGSLTAQQLPGLLQAMQEDSEAHRLVETSFSRGWDGVSLDLKLRSRNPIPGAESEYISITLTNECTSTLDYLYQISGLVPAGTP